MRKKVSVSEKVKGNYRYVCYFPDEGKRREKYFKTKAAAKDFADQRQEEIDAKGAESAALSSHEMLAVTMWRTAQSSYKELNSVSLESVVSDYLSRHKARLDSISLADCIDKLHLGLQMSGKSKRHRETVESHMRKFEKTFPNWMMSDFTREQVFDYLVHMESSPTTKLNHLRSITSLFNKALQLGVVEVSPVVNLSKDLEKPVWEEPEIYSVEDTLKLLSACPERSLAAFVLGFFCGLRPSELERIHWKHVKLNTGKLTLPASKTKTKSRRVVDIPKNALSWLQPLARPSGPIVQSKQCYRTDRDKAHELCGVEKVNNGLRHSFCSYHVALHESADKTALLLGHRGAAVLYDHYRSIVDHEEGVRYFNLSPLEGDNIVKITA